MTPAPGDLALLPDDASVDALVTGAPVPAHLVDLAALADAVRRQGEGPPPVPSEELAALLNGQTPVRTGRPPRHRWRLTAVAAIGALGAGATLAFAGAAGVLPGPIDDAVRTAVEAVTPFDRGDPDPSTPVVTDGGPPAPVEGIADPATGHGPVVPTGPAGPAGPDAPGPTEPDLAPAAPHPTVPGAVGPAVGAPADPAHPTDPDDPDAGGPAPVTHPGPVPTDHDADTGAAPTATSGPTTSRPAPTSTTPATSSPATTRPPATGPATTRPPSGPGTTGGPARVDDSAPATTDRSPDD